MVTRDSPPDLLWSEVEDLRRRLAEADETLEAIRSGEVDALVVRQGVSNQVFTLDGAERPYRVFVEEMQQGAVTLGQGGTILFCNHRFSEMLRCPHTRIAGRPFESLLTSASLERWRAQLPTSGNGRAACELELQRQDGTVLPVFVAVSAMPSSERASLAVVVADLTEQRYFERLRIAEQQLRELLAAAHKANRAKDHFLALLGHELRNPLGPIRNAIFLMRMAPTDGSVLQEARAVIERQVVQMARLLDDLLDLSRIANGKITLRKEKVDLTQVVTAAVADHRQVLEARDLALEFCAPPEMPVYGDAVRITQIVGNLLVNAAKFTDPGGRLTIRVEPGGRGEVVISVADTGIGLDPGHLVDLFDPFMQAEEGKVRGDGGLGLGLALVKGLVELHGGRIEASSPGLGLGSTFTARLPIALEASGPAPPPVEAEPPAPARSLRVLVIEDNVDAAQTLRMVLSLHGHAVAVAHAGPEGVEKALLFNPDMVLCDIGLPGGMDGYAVAKAIRTLPGIRVPRLIAMTGFGLEADRQHALSAGFDHHLTKPADPEALLRLLADSRAD